MLLRPVAVLQHLIAIVETLCGPSVGQCSIVSYKALRIHHQEEKKTRLLHVCARLTILLRENLLHMPMKLFYPTLTRKDLGKEIKNKKLIDAQK